MGLISLVARENFISVLTDLGSPQVKDDPIRFKVLIPDTSFIASFGDEVFTHMTVLAAETLIKQGLCLGEIADLIQSSYTSGALSLEQSGRPFEAVLAGYSSENIAQYHIISNSKELESFYPAAGESLYYANVQESMIVFDQMLKTYGMGTIAQSLEAQKHFFREAAKIIPHVYAPSTSLVFKRAN